MLDERKTITKSGEVCRIIRAHSSETWDVDGGGSLDVKYWVIGNVPQNEAMQACWDDAGDSIKSFKKKSIRFDGYDEDRNAEFTVSYQAPAGSSGATETTDTEATVSFSCGGGTRHVTYARTQKLYGTPPYNFGNGINWNGEIGESAAFDGVDVPSANLQETYTKVMTVASAKSISFRRKVASLVGCVNSTTFKGWSRGEALFTGCSYSGVDDDSAKIQVSFNFSIKTNESRVYVGGIYISKVEGWQYVWTSRPKKVTRDGKLSFDSQFACVSDVVEYKDFSALGL